MRTAEQTINPHSKRLHSTTTHAEAATRAYFFA
jgi:hypothetical protein